MLELGITGMDSKSHIQQDIFVLVAINVTKGGFLLSYAQPIELI